MILRVALVVIFALLAVVGGKTIDSFNQSNIYSNLSSAVKDNALFSKAWAKRLYKQASALADDKRIKNALAGKVLNDPKILRRALYEFAYVQNLTNVYIFSEALDSSVIYPATAAVPTADLMDYVQGKTQKNIRIFPLNKGSGVLVTVPIVDDASETNIGTAVFLEPAEKILYRHKRSTIRNLPEYSTLLLDKDAYGKPQVFTNIFSLNNTKSIIWPQQLNRWLREENFSYLNLGGEKLVAFAPVPNADGWWLGLSVLKSVVATQSFYPKLVLYLFCFLGILVIILYPLKELIIAKIKRIIDGDLSPVPKISTDNLSPHVDYREIYAKKQNRKILATHTETEPTHLYGEKKAPLIPPVVTKSPERKLADTIEASLVRKRTKLLFQPIFDVHTLKPIMAEVFLRIEDEEGETITPAMFLPIAQRYKLLPKIDAHVMNRVIDEYVSIGGDKQLPLGINLGGGTFESIAFLQTMINKLKPEWSNKIVLELRSQEIIKDTRAMDFIKNCRNLGCLFSIDYFGGGPSMLAGTKRMNFNYLKLDGLAFDTPEKKKELIRLSAAAKEIGLELVLERIENEDMVTLARKIGIPYLQGYHLAKPSEILEWELENSPDMEAMVNLA